MAVAFQLAWFQLRHEPRKLLAGVAGVVFAVVLCFMQLGFSDALFDSATAVQRRMTGDLFIVHRQSQALWRMTPFARRRVQQALGVPGVASAGLLYAGTADWKNQRTVRRDPILVLGIDPVGGVLELPGLRDHLDAIKNENVVVFDEWSRPEYGPVAALLRANQPVAVEVNHRRLRVAGVFRLGASFAANGNLVTSELNFLRLFPGRSPSQADVGILRLRPGADIRVTQKAVASLMPDDVRVLTKQEFIHLERNYWEETTAIGFIFTVSLFMGFVVGVVVVYQILYSEIMNHLPQYATLKAMGYTHGFLLGVVGSAALMLSVLGYLPGLVVSAGLYHLTSSATALPMGLGVPKLALVFGLTLGMCLLSGALALRKLRAANPADMF
ncbi:MAG: FtsX-like permease family protein [Verrucomicrobia bacterium]|nr:FtsX-like permease family protein [Verrucomicrobiota bacterium]